jgi:hypothetical protein
MPGEALNFEKAANGEGCRGITYTLKLNNLDRILGRIIGYLAAGFHWEYRVSTLSAKNG